MTLTKEKIVSIIIRFFTEEKKYTYYKLASITYIDPKSIKAWEKQERSNIRLNSVNQLTSRLNNYIHEELAFEQFSNFAISELTNTEPAKSYIRKIFYDNQNLCDIINELQNFNIPTHKFLQEKIGPANIIQTLKKFLSEYREYFQINEKEIQEGNTSNIYKFLSYDRIQSNGCEQSNSDNNYLILKFPNAYCVGIILSNYQIDYSNQDEYNNFSYMIGKLKTYNNLNMLLFITDTDKNNIPFHIQSQLIKEHNLFFEFVTEKDLQEISLQNFEFQGENLFTHPELIEQHKYARLIFERFMSYLSVICNEIIFLPYLEKLHKELDLEKSDKLQDKLNRIFISNNKTTDTGNFTYYAKEILIKEICRYSYLSRHVIYYERNLISEKFNNKKFNLVVEICAPNSLTTCNIIDKCEKLLLFTSSHSAYSIMMKLQEKMNNHFFPNNVSLKISHLNPEYMMHQYPNELNGKVDLLVIGYGAGSQISDLTRFIRYAYNWLSKNGVLFISVYNKEAIIFNKHHTHDQRFETFPLYISDYWTYTMNEQSALLKNLKAYSPYELKSTYLSVFDTDSIDISTYPYISTLINPNEYSRTILDEIREADKSFASKGVHGQLIDAFAYKNKSVKKNDANIKHYLNNLNIQYDYYNHTLSPDSNSLKRSLQAKSIPMSNATLLKCVVLQEKAPKLPRNNGWSYAILPYDKRVVFDNTKYELVPEISVINKFNQGTISPLAIIAEKTEKYKSNNNIFLLYNDRINTEYVIVSGGSNTKSIRLKTNDFLNIIKQAKVKFLNIIE